MATTNYSGFFHNDSFQLRYDTQTIQCTEHISDRLLNMTLVKRPQLPTRVVIVRMSNHTEIQLKIVNDVQPVLANVMNIYKEWVTTQSPSCKLTSIVACWCYECFYHNIQDITVCVRYD